MYFGVIETKSQKLALAEDKESVFAYRPEAG
jgi:hypothetical protein